MANADRVVERPGNEYSQEYSEGNFWNKLGSYSRVAGTEVIERALQLFYAAQDSRTPAWARGVIFASLGYFIAPLDAIPDLVPVAGYSDDLGVLALAVATVIFYITPEVKEKSRAKMRDWFGDSAMPNG
jgi:uncharacterized membrane protein YkvA (DUF1232 family)